MGSPSKAVAAVTRNVQESTADLVKAPGQIVGGQSERGLDNLVSGMVGTGLSPMGISGTVFNPFPGETAMMRKAGEAATAEATDVAAGTAAETAAKQKKINTRLEEEIRLRKKTPGRAQTLLTSSLAPSGTSTGTLLTGAKK